MISYRSLLYIATAMYDSSSISQLYQQDRAGAHCRVCSRARMRVCILIIVHVWCVIINHFASVNGYYNWRLMRISTNPFVSNIVEFQPDNESITLYLRVSLFFEVNGIQEQKQVAWLLNLIGAKTYFSLVWTLVAPAEPKTKKLAELMEVLKQHYEPKRLVRARRFYFHQKEQATNESIVEYAGELHKLAAPRDFGDYLNDALHDRLVCGLCSESTLKRLLSKGDLSHKGHFDSAEYGGNRI